MVPIEGTLTLKLDLVFDTRYFEYYIMTYLVLGFCAYLYDYGGPFLLGQVRELGSCLEVYYLSLNCWLASLILLKRNWICGVGWHYDQDRDMVSFVRTLPVHLPLGSRMVKLKSLCPRLMWWLGSPRSDVMLGGAWLCDVMCINEGFFCLHLKRTIGSRKI